MGKIKSLIVTLALMGMLWWAYELTDMYAWAAHQIINGILVVAGMIGIGFGVYVFMRLDDQDIRTLLTGRRKKESWEVGWTGEWQR